MSTHVHPLSGVDEARHPGADVQLHADHWDQTREPDALDHLRPPSQLSSLNSLSLAEDHRRFLCVCVCVCASLPAGFSVLSPMLMSTARLARTESSLAAKRKKRRAQSDDRRTHVRGKEARAHSQFSLEYGDGVKM